MLIFFCLQLSNTKNDRKIRIALWFNKTLPPASIDNSRHYKPDALEKITKNAGLILVNGVHFLSPLLRFALNRSLASHQSHLVLALSNETEITLIPFFRPVSRFRQFVPVLSLQCECRRYVFSRSKGHDLVFHRRARL